MGSDPILAVGEDIDDEIRVFCGSRPRLQPVDVIRDIARIVCITNMVENGTLNGTNMVLCGGMAMRCLDSPRMSIFDGDTASASAPDIDQMRDRISHDEDDIEIAAGPWRPGPELITFAPVTYDARFSELAGAQDEFSLSVAYRGIERPAIWRKLNHRYPFDLLSREIEVPIMDPDEILAEKTVSWLLFGHAKHYNDLAFLGGRLLTQRVDTDPQRRRLYRALVDKKLEVNRSVSENLRKRVDRLNEAERRLRLATPDDHVDPSHGFDSLSYLHKSPPSRESVNALVQRVLIPMLFD